MENRKYIIIYMMMKKCSFLFLSLFLFSVSLPAQTNLHNYISHISSTSLKFTWDNVSSPWIAALSTNNFSSTISTGSISSNTTNYPNLDPNTTYYFRVKAASEGDTAYLLGANSISTATLTQVPVNLKVEFSYAYSSAAAQLVINFDSTNPPYTRYILTYSKEGGPASDSYIQGYPPLVLSNLLANTTYQVQIKGINLNGVQSAYSSLITTSTLAIPPDIVSHDVYQTSVTVNWSAVNSVTQELSGEGYNISVSTCADFNTILTSWSTNDNTLTSHTFDGLVPNTTHYYRMGTLNWNGENNYLLKELTTLTLPPANFKLIYVSSIQAQLSWDPLAPSPSSSSALGYALEASTDPAFSVTVSSVSFRVQPSTLTVGILDSNSTYYFRIGILNTRGDANYSAKIETTTLSLPLSLGEIAFTASTISVTAVYYPLPLSPDSLSCKGYILDASTNPFTTGVIYSSTSYNPSNISLRIDNLRPNTNYYFRLATLNHSMNRSYSDTKIVKTPLPGGATNVKIKTIGDTYFTVSYDTIPSDGYIFEISKDQFINVFKTSATADNNLGELTISGLNTDTLFYFRQGSLFNGSYVYELPDIKYAYTYAPPVTGQALGNVYISSVSASWTTVIGDGYQLEASTSASYNGIIYSSMTANTNSGSITVENLIPNTSFYLRIGSVNADDRKNYVNLPSTVTMANFPVQTPYTKMSTNTFQVNWNPNSNPPDTVYSLQISSYSDFSWAISSNTKNNFVYFDNTYDLQYNTTFYQRILTYNRKNRITGPIEFSSVATLAYDPDPGTFSNVFKSSITLSWGKGGSNSFPGTVYLAQISSTAFNDSIISSTTLNLSSTFYNLLSNTSYYLRVSALNYSGIPSNYVSLSTALTRPNEPALPSGTDYDNLMVDGFRAHWEANFNSSATIYMVQTSTDPDFSVFASSGETLNTYFPFGGLKTNTQYYSRVKARGMTGFISDWTVLASTGTLLFAQKVATTEEDTYILLPFSYGSIELYVPFKSIGGATRISVIPETSFPAPDSNAGIMVPTGVGIRVSNFPPTVFLGPVTVKIPYRDSDLPPSTDKNKLVVATYNETARLWVPLDSLSDTVNRYVSGKTFHFSLFQIMVLLPAESLANIKIYPNPYRPKNTAGLMNFGNAPAGTKIYIYTATGELVKKLKVNEYGMTTWDGKNENNLPVASGVYITLFKTPDGRNKIKKIAVEK